MNDNNTSYFATRDQYIFICYKDIIKHCYPMMLKKIIDEYYEELNSFLYLDMIKDYDIYNLERLCVERIDINPLKYIKRDICSNETADELLKTFEDDMYDMYTHSKFTLFGAKIFNLLVQKQIKGIYIYVDRRIDQILYDCKVHFDQFGDKIKYVCGDFIDVIKKLPNKPTSYIINDVDYIQKLIDNDLIEFTEVIVAELGYNFKLSEGGNIILKNDYESLMKEKIFKIGYLPTIELDDKHLSGLKPKE